MQVRLWMLLDQMMRKGKTAQCAVENVHTVAGLRFQCRSGHASRQFPSLTPLPGNKRWRCSPLSRSPTPSTQDQGGAVHNVRTGLSSSISSAKQTCISKWYLVCYPNGSGPNQPKQSQYKAKSHFLHGPMITCNCDPTLPQSSLSVMDLGPGETKCYHPMQYLPYLQIRMPDNSLLATDCDLMGSSLALV